MPDAASSSSPSRRDFLKRAVSALAVSSIGFPAVLLPGSDDPLGVALCGLGTYSTTQLAPALQETEHCEVRGIVTGSPEKIPVWQRRYGIADANVYSYETLPDIADNDAIDVVYIVTPPGLHARDAVKAAEAGKHVWCEKPMAMDAAECRSIIDAADRNGVQLTVGYRLQHEPNNRTIMRYAREKPYGAVEEVRTGAGYDGAHPDPDDWRRDAERGGGALYDMGVYPINAARYATGLEPTAVKGRLWSERAEMYSEVPEFAEFTLRFPGGVRARGNRPTTSTLSARTAGISFGRSRRTAVFAEKRATAPVSLPPALTSRRGRWTTTRGPLSPARIRSYPDARAWPTSGSYAPLWRRPATAGRGWRWIGEGVILSV
jgi:glucose-fructose oxidoreductase